MRAFLAIGVMMGGGLLGSFSQSAFAQVYGQGQGDGAAAAENLLAPKPMAQRSLNDQPTRNYQGLPLEGWMLYPSLFVGAVFDDNVYQSTTNRVADTGLKMRPSFVGEYDAHRYKTTVFANGDFNIYPDRAAADTTNAQVGFTQTWEARRDLTFKLGAEYDRHTDIYNNGVVTTALGQAGYVASPQRYNVFGGYVSGLKSFDKFFFGLTASAYATSYDALYTTSGAEDQTYRNNLVTTVSGRLGYRVTNLIYAFADASGNFHNFSDATALNLITANVPTPGVIYNSEGFRVVSGLGTDRIRLFKGEIYAGYQQQIYDYSGFGAPSSPVFGGKVYWYPTRALTVTAALDETYQDSGLTTVGNPTGSAAHVTAATTNIQYVMSKHWNATVGGGYADVDYVTGGRRDHRWNANATVNYEIFRNLAATFNYALVVVDSNEPGGSFTRNQFSLGATYKY